MNSPVRCSLGLDFGTESVRALVVNVASGEELAQAVVPYAHGVITEKLPGTDRVLPRNWALQSAEDYLESATSAIAQILKQVAASSIIGVGVDFTACTLIPVLRDGTPLMSLPQWRAEPHAWVKLWKHHGAQQEANELNALAFSREESFLKYYGGVVSSEWFIPKALEIARHAPEVYAAADLLVDAGDWFVRQMTGEWTRSTCSAGYKGFWNAESEFPSVDFLSQLDPRIENLSSKWVTQMLAPGKRAGGVSGRFAALSGLIAGTPVSAATIDAHAGVPGMGVYREGTASLILGTSGCHMILSRGLKFFEGYAGVVQDGIIEGFYGYESGQAAVGDLFAWFSRFVSRPLDELSREAEQVPAGSGNLVALDWMNGNRSVLMNSSLTGVIAGLSLASKPAEVYRALIEATAFGTRKILDTYHEAGVPVQELAVCGGLTRHSLIMQIYADVLGLPVRVAASDQAVALGSAIFGALAAEPSLGGYQTLEDAIARMTRPPQKIYVPHSGHRAIYDRAYSIYSELHDYFGRTRSELLTRI